MKEKSMASSSKIIAGEMDYPGVAYIRDVEYIRRGDISRTIQILQPLEMDITKKYPLVIYIQGSAFRAQEMYLWLPQLANFARRGYVVASVQYRGSDLARFPSQIEDVKAGVRYMCAHAEEYHADPEKLVIWGDSSGGSTALLVGLTMGMDLLDAGDYADVPVNIKGIIDWYGAIDQRVMLHTEKGQVDPEMEDIFYSLFGPDAEEKNPELVASSVPTKYITPDHQIPPILIFHGDADVTVPYSQSVILYDALVKAGKDVDFYTVSGAAHGGPAFHAPSVTNIMDAFIRRVTK